MEFTGHGYYQAAWETIQKICMFPAFPVSVKMLESADLLDQIRDEEGRPIRKVEGKIAACQLMAQAHTWGKVQGGTAQSLSLCVGGAAYMGFRDLPKEWLDTYCRAYYPTEQLSQLTVNDCPKFEPFRYAAMVAAPLDKTPVDPDVIVFFPNAAQTYLLTAAYLYNKGGAIDAQFSQAWGVCGSMVAQPVNTGKATISIPDNGARMIAFSSDHELTFAIPGALLDDFIQGLEFVYEGRMARYPTPYQHINAVPGGPMGAALEGKGLYAKEDRQLPRRP
jgi:uncharacterized protein (DUF169 family)